MLVAVYGSLKRGYGNYGVIKKAGGKFISNGVTKNSYFIMDGYGYPYIIKDKNNPLARQVEVEVFDIQNIEPIDWLEGHPTFYKREKQPIILENGQVIDTWIYIYQDSIQTNPDLIKNNVYVW